LNNEIILQAVNISKHFSGNNALDQVNFNLHKGEVHALIGENGAGKSTLMNIISGIIKPSKGHLEIGQKQVNLTSSHHANELGISTVFQELSLVPNLTVAENIFFSRQPVNPFGFINKKALYQKTAELIQMLDIPLSPEMIVKRLSAANQQLVEILKAISLEPKILILDEPTSSLTVHEVEQLFRLMMKLKENGTGIIYISHHLEEITAISDRVTILRDGKKINTIQTKDTTEQELVRLMVGRDILKIDRTIENPFRSDTPILQLKGFL
jgi:ABC-type sugar transport system ATPase subunit